MFQAFLLYTHFYQLSVFLKTPACILEAGLLGSKFPHAIAGRFLGCFYNIGAMTINNGNTIMLNP